MAQDAQARLLIVAQAKDLLSNVMRAMGVSVDAFTGDVQEATGATEQLGQAYRLLDALQGPAAASAAEMGQGLNALAGGARAASQALDAFGDYESLVAAEAEGGVRAVREFTAALEATRAEVARIKAQGPPEFAIGAATAGTVDEQMARQFAAARVIFGRDLAAELRQQQEWIAAQKILDPALRKTLQAEQDLAAAIRQATVDERAHVEAFVKGEQEIAAAIKAATTAEVEQVEAFSAAQKQKIALLQRFHATLNAGAAEHAAQSVARMEATAAGAFDAAMQRGAASSAEFTAAIKAASAAETEQLARTSELARALRGAPWQSAIDGERQLKAATEMLGAAYVEATQNAQRFFEAQRARGVAAPVAAAKAQGRFESDLATFRALANPNTKGFEKFRAEIAGGAIAVRSLTGVLGGMAKIGERTDQIFGSTASTLIIFFVAINKIREATGQALEFSRALTQIATITDLTGRQVGELGEQVRDLALSFGVNEIDVARGLYFTLSSGIEDTAEALKLVTAANELAVTGFATVEQTIDLLTSTINAYGLTVDDARRLNDLFFTTVRVGKAELPELAHNLGAVLPIASQMGVSLEELTAAISALTLGGQNADEAVTSIRQLLINLINPSTDAEQIIGELQQRTDKLGDSTLAAALKSRGLLEVMRGLAESVGNNSTKMRELIPDARGFVAVSALAGNQLGVFERTLNATTNAAGANAKALEKVFVSQAKQIEIVQAGIRQGFLDIGQSIISGFAPLDGTAEGAKAAADSIRNAISGLVPVVDIAIKGLKDVGVTFLLLRNAAKFYEASLSDLTDTQEEYWRKAGEAERARMDLSALIEGPAGFDALSRALTEAKSNVSAWAETNVKAQERVKASLAEMVRIRADYLRAGFTEGTGGGPEGKDVDYFMGRDERVTALKKAIDEAKAAASDSRIQVEYWLGLEGGGSFDQAITRAKESIASFRERLMRERNLALGAPVEEEAGDRGAARKAEEQYEAAAKAAAKYELALKSIKNLSAREEFESSARLAARFGSELDKSLVTAQERVRELQREFKQFKYDLVVRGSKGEFGPSTSDAALNEQVAQLKARTQLFDAEEAAAKDHVRSAQAAIDAQRALAASTGSVEAAMTGMTSAMSRGDLVLAGLTAAFTTATRNAPDFAEAVRATEYLKEATEKLKLSKLEEAQAEVAAVVSIRRRFIADVDAGRITGDRVAQIQSLIDTLYDQATAERRVQEEREGSRAFAFLPGVAPAINAGIIAAREQAQAYYATEKTLKEDLDLLDQRRVTTLAQEADALRDRLAAMEESIPAYQAMRLLNERDADQMRERIALIRETTLAELDKRAAVEERERFLKTQDFGGGFVSAFEEFTRQVDEGFERGQIIGQSFFSNLENGFANIVSGATSAKDAFRQFAQAVLADISRLLVRMILMNTIGKLLGGLFGGGGGLPSPGTGGNLDAGVDIPTSGPGGLNYRGNVFENGNVRRFSRGGVPDSIPDIGDRMQYFRTRDGRMNSLREGGKPEAIVPLKRGPGGALGIAAFGMPPAPVVQGIDVVARPDTRAFAAQASTLMAASRTFEREIMRVGNSVRPGVRAIPLGRGAALPEFDGRGAVRGSSASGPVSVSLSLNFQSLDPSRAADVVKAALPSLERDLTNIISDAIQRGRSSNLTASIRSAAGTQ